jgi:hypothetical protein
MIRKLLVVAAAVAMPVSVIAVTGGVAAAHKSPTVANDTIHCTAESATVHLNPALTPAGVSSGPAATTTITSSAGSIHGCTVAGPVPVTGTVTGTLSGTVLAKKPPSAKHPGSTCGGLLGATKSGKGSTLTITWSGGSVSLPPSSIALKSVIGGTASDGHGSFNVTGKASKTGSFGGADKGKSSSLTAETTQTVAQLAAECTPSPGISSVGIQATASGITLQ